MFEESPSEMMLVTLSVSSFSTNQIASHKNEYEIWMTSSKAISVFVSLGFSIYIWRHTEHNLKIIQMKVRKNSACGAILK